jgi:hypothetical protein
MNWRAFSILVFAACCFTFIVSDVEARGARGGSSYRASSSKGKSYGGTRAYSTKSSRLAGSGTGSTYNSTSVRGHVRKDGTYVQPHRRTKPDSNFNNNWSTRPNVNPYTGKEGSQVTPPPYRH